MLYLSHQYSHIALNHDLEPDILFLDDNTLEGLGSMIPVDLSTKPRVGSMIRVDLSTERKTRIYDPI